MKIEKQIIPSNRLPDYIWAKVSKNGDIILDIFLFEPYMDKVESEFNYLKRIKIKEIYYPYEHTSE